MNAFYRAALLGAAVLLPTCALADAARPDAHAPIGVMGDHMHKAGEYMFSYRYMTMEMQGNLLGSDSISNDTIVTTIPNRFFGAPGQPPTLRIVPTEMTMDMHMFGAMYAPTDKITLMVMANYLQNDMDHVTYQGGMGTNVLGTFSTSTGGWSDTTVSGLVSLLDRPQMKVHATLGLSLPTGSIDERDDILTPMNMRPTVRTPYPMQLGSGSYDPILGLTYNGSRGAFAWGAQWRSTLRVMDNDEDYRLGDEHRLTGWVSYLVSPNISTSVRLAYADVDSIEGRDMRIAGPVQTADPDRLGGEATSVAVGVNFLASGSLDGWRLGLEYNVPVDQDLNGPQLETDSTVTLGLQKAW